MAIRIRHIKTNQVADWTQADLDYQISIGNYPSGTTLEDIVLPSDWNGDHDIAEIEPMLLHPFLLMGA